MKKDFNSTMKFGYIDNGLHSFQAFSPMGTKFIPLSVWELKKVNICRFHALIIPFHTDQIALGKSQNRLKFYLERGGILILLGAMAHCTSWIPDCDWLGPITPTKSLKIERSGAGKLILNGIEDNDIFKIHAHGTFIHSGGESIIQHNNGRNIMVVDSENYLGSFLITTLDPDHHIVPDTTSMKKDISKIFQQLLQNIVDWARHTHSLKSGFKWKIQRFRAIIEGFLRSNLFIFGLLSIVIVGLLIVLSIKANFYFTLIGGLASIIALIYSFLHK